MVGYYLFCGAMIVILILSGVLVRTINRRDSWQHQATVYLSALELDIPFPVKETLSNKNVNVWRTYSDRVYFVESDNVRGKGMTLLEAIVDYTQYQEAVRNVRALRGETV